MSAIVSREVDPRDVAGKNGAGVMGYRPIELPAGKKPLVLSVDDVNYYEYMNDDGFATNLTLDGDGELTNTYIDASGATTHGSFDVPTIVDDFVEDHPDFSYRGARGVLALTGYNGVLGYRTSDFTYVLTGPELSRTTGLHIPVDSGVAAAFLR